MAKFDKMPPDIKLTKDYNFMRINLELNDKIKSPLREDFLKLVARETLREVGYEFLKDKNISLSVALVAPAEIKSLNRRYRRKNAVTDVLSFAEYENIRALKKEREKKIFLGELILCYDDIKAYAQKEKLALKKELATVISHGVLHLLGFDHGQKMFAIQVKVVNKING